MFALSLVIRYRAKLVTIQRKKNPASWRDRLFINGGDQRIDGVIENILRIIGGLFSGFAVFMAAMIHFFALFLGIFFLKKRHGGKGSSND